MIAIEIKITVIDCEKVFSSTNVLIVLYCVTFAGKLISILSFLTRRELSCLRIKIQINRIYSLAPRCMLKMERDEARGCLPCRRVHAVRLSAKFKRNQINIVSGLNDIACVLLHDAVPSTSELCSHSL